MNESPGNPQGYPSFLSLPKEIQGLIRQRSETIQKLIFWVTELFAEPVLPPDLENQRLCLRLVSSSLRNLRKEHPVQSYRFLKRLSDQIKMRTTGLMGTIEYLEFLGEFLAAANWNADISNGGQICSEASAIVNRLINRMGDGIDKLSPLDFARYRWPLVDTVTNIAYYYSRKGDLANAQESGALWRKLASDFWSAHGKFNLLILEIQIEMGKSPRDDSVISNLFDEGERYWLPVLHKAYSHEGTPGEGPHIWKYIDAKREYDLLRFQHDIQKANLSDVHVLAGILSTWTQQWKQQEKDDFDASDRQILFQIEIILYIAIQRCLRNLNNTTQIDLDLDLNIGKEWQFEDALETILQNQYHIDTHGLDVDNTLKQDNGWFFLGSLVELFAYRVDSIPELPWLWRSVAISHALHMMIDICQTALGWGDIERRVALVIFQQRTFYDQYMQSTRKLLGLTNISANNDQPPGMANSYAVTDYTLLDPVSDDATSTLSLLTELADLRDSLEDNNLRHVFEQIKSTNKLDIVSVKKIHMLDPQKNNDFLVEETRTFSNVKNTLIQVVVPYAYNGDTYIIQLQHDENRAPSQEIQEACIERVKSIMPTIFKKRKKPQWRVDFQTSGNQTQFQYVIRHMWQLGIPRDSGEFFRSILEPTSIAQRIDLSHVNRETLLREKWVPTIITLEGDDQAISVVNIGERDGHTLLAVRFWITPAHISYNLPPYDALCIVEISPDSRAFYQPIRLNAQTVDRLTNTNQALYQTQLTQLLRKIWANISDQGGSLACIHNGRLFQIYELWKVAAQTTFEVGVQDDGVTPLTTFTNTEVKLNFLVQIETPNGVSVQLIISSYKEQSTGNDIIYIWSMVSSWSADIGFISKWFSSILTDVRVKERYPFISDKTRVIWERNDSYTGKLPVSLIITRWHGINMRLCPTGEPITLDWIPDGTEVATYYASFIEKLYWHHRNEFKN